MSTFQDIDTPFLWQVQVKMIFLKNTVRNVFTYVRSRILDTLDFTYFLSKKPAVYSQLDLTEPYNDFLITMYRILQNVRKPSSSRSEGPKWKSALVGWTENCLNLNNNKTAKRYKIMSSFRQFSFWHVYVQLQIEDDVKMWKIQWPICLNLMSHLPHFDVIYESTFTEQTHRAKWNLVSIC